MFNKRNLIFFTLLIFFISVSFLYSENSLTAREIVKRVDKLYRSKTSYGKMEMTIETPHWKRTLLMEAWTEGMEKTFIRILAPKKDKNMATLKIGNQMWNYLPKVNKIIKIPPSMMMGSWMGSDFTNDDLVKEYTFVDDYNFKIIDFKEENSKDRIYIEAIPKENVAVVWSKIIIAVKKDNYIPIWQRYYDDRGDVVRIMYYSEVKKIGNRLIPTKMVMVPLKKKGHKTSFKYLEIKFDIKLKKSIFSLRNLRNLR